ncbi:MAG TPA: hypothetical protein VM536_17605 [Chloroflexia bacterium]|nr:hypothetical protein [Chloroflexia bacterium]
MVKDWKQRGLAGLIILAGLLAACDTAAPSPTAVPPAPSPTIEAIAPTAVPARATNTVAVAPPPSSTAAPAPPTETTSVAADPTNTVPLQATPGVVFNIPTAEPTPAEAAVTLPAALTKGAPDYGAELEAYFALFYKARTLPPGGKFDFTTVSGLTAPPYLDYTLELLEKSQADADAGKIKEITYSNVVVQGFGPEPESGNAPADFTVTIGRTQNQVLATGKTSSQLLSLTFRMRRTPVAGGKVSWQAYDFQDPTALEWISAAGLAKIPADQALTESTAFFDRFYQARTLVPGGAFDFATTGELTRFAYQDYTLPLLQQQQDEAGAGRLQAVNYSDLKVKLESWEPAATTHGGIATVAVTRTSHVQRPGQREELQTGTYRFRLHRHVGEAGAPFWVAVDFVTPITNKWVSESAGLAGPIPPAGRG